MIDSLVVVNSYETLLAYVGPGPGLTMLMALFGVLATLGVALWAVALWPLRALFRKLRTARREASHGGSGG